MGAYAPFLRQRANEPWRKANLLALWRLVQKI